jgi:hypothetical protein
MNTPDTETPRLDIDDDTVQKAAPAEPTAPTSARRGRPRGSTRDGVANESARELPRGQYVGRNGEILSRAVNVGAGDQFEIPAHLKEPGWDYQWLTEHIYNNPDIVRRHNHQMYQGGWRAVTATGRWNGVFGPKSDTGHIRVGDAGLYERPLGMSEDAREEDIKRARQQMSDRDQSLMGGKANVRGTVPADAMNSRKYRGTGADLRMSIDPALDVPVPKHTLAAPGE